MTSSEVWKFLATWPLLAFFLKSLHANEAMRMSTNICLCRTLRTFDTGQLRSLAASPLCIYFFFVITYHFELLVHLFWQSS